MANAALNRLTQNYRRGAYGPADLSSPAVTLQSVVQKTFATLGLLILAAIGSWAWTGSLLQDALYGEAGYKSHSENLVTGVLIGSSLAALALSFWISFKRKPSPALVILYSLLEGVVIGSLSRFLTIQLHTVEPVVGAVVGTMITAGVTFAAYRYFNIQVTPRMRKFTMLAMFSLVGVSLADLVLSFFGSSLGVNGFGAMGSLFSVLGIIVAIFMLLTDFDAVERAIAYRLPEAESWRLAFGLTVTLVWIYINILRLLTNLQRS